MQLPCQGSRIGAACRGRPTVQLRQGPIAVSSGTAARLLLPGGVCGTPFVPVRLVAHPSLPHHRPSLQLATPARRTNNGSNSYLNFSDFDAVGDDMNLMDAKTRLYDDYMRNDAAPMYTSPGRRRTGGNMAWNRYDSALYGDLVDDEFEDEYYIDEMQPKPATLSDEKRFLNGKQILTNYDIT